MSEEQACLVRPRSDSETSSKLGSFGSIQPTMAYTEGSINAEAGSGEPGPLAPPLDLPPERERESTESGELIDYSETGVRAQFHEDAMKQAGCGIYQVLVMGASALAVMGSSLELAATPFILPSAEIELCIQPHEKSWLVTISMFGLWVGGAGWGALADRGGRRRALLSALAVNAVFATIAAFMPTYGTAMMARFCSAIGSGGIIPSVFAYVTESLPGGWARAGGAALAAGGAAGGAWAAGVAAALVAPPVDADHVTHFSAWHRYLLLCTLPILASLVCLLWTHESPRYLLEAGREHDACTVYQSIHTSNLRCRCGDAGKPRDPSHASYRLSELALPKRGVPALRLRHTVKMFWQSFFQLFSTSYRTTTLTLGSLLTLTLTLQFYLSAYIPTTVLRMESDQFHAAKRHIDNGTFENQLFNHTIENIEYSNSSFVNCTFRDMLLLHVKFTNCSFVDVTFANIRASYSLFEDSEFVNSSMLDTDIDGSRDLRGCTLVRTRIRGVLSQCRADLSLRLDALFREQGYLCGAAAAAALAAVLCPPRVALAIACFLLSPSLLFAESETALYVIEAIYRLVLVLMFFSVSLSVVQTYPANMRCTAHGLLVSVAYMGGMLGREAGGVGGSILATIVTATLAAAAVVAAAAHRQYGL